MDALDIFYKTVPGRLLLKPVVSKPVSALAGKILDSRMSKIAVGPFVRNNGIRTEDYHLEDVGSFNDFFRRRIKEELRPVCADKKALVAPCDGRLSLGRIRNDKVIRVKQSEFTVSGLLRDEKLASEFEGGHILVFRLCVDDYHRYVYFDSGMKQADRKIDGVFHTVRPVALERYPVFVENCREYSVIDTDSFGRCVQMEVGALLVGRIVNVKKTACRVSRGEEKGFFEYGGSTVIVLIRKDRISLRDDLSACGDTGIEIPVKMGERLGTAV